MTPSIPSADDIRRKAIEVLQRPEYQLDAAPAGGTGNDALIWRVLNWFGDALLSLANSLSGLPGALRYVVAVLLIALLVWLVYRIIRSLAGAARLPHPGAASGERGSRATHPDELEGLADAARRDGRIIEAVRWLFRAALLRIELVEKRRHRPGTTNRELLRRYRATLLQEPLRTLVDTIDLHFYGDRPARAADYERCRQSYEQLCVVIAAAARPATASVTRPPSPSAG